MQMNVSPISTASMCWYWVRNLREEDLELNWEKLQRTLLDGSLLVASQDTNSDDMEDEFHVRVNNSLFKQNSREYGLHHSENSKRKYNLIHYREPVHA